MAVYSDYFSFITYALIAFTVGFSFWCFRREDRLDKYSFIPYAIKENREHYRFLSHAFIHADEIHLIFNMIGLYFFGPALEFHFVTNETFGFAGGEAIYLAFYSTAIYAAVIPQYFKLKNDRSYASLGASGAVNAIVFAYIMVNPKAQLGLLLIPGRVDAWIFGLIYLGISYFLARRKSRNPMVDRINHEAHFWGAFYGILFMSCVEPGLVVKFFNQVTGVGH
jgi:membrane associated rhomboid family serine protease